MATPLVVVGRNRSGTKWLTNLIARHPDVVCPQHPRHRGVIECDLLHHGAQLFGPLELWENRAGCLAAFAASDFFRVTGLAPATLYDLSARTYPGVVRQVLDAWAEARQVRHWVLKIDTSALASVRAAWPDAWFVGIVRDPVDTARSSLAMDAALDRPLRPLPVIALSCVLASKRLDALRGDPRGRVVDYGRLKADRQRVIAEIARAVGLDPDPRMTEDVFRPNTSFAGRDRSAVLSRQEQRRFEGLLRVLHAVPLPVLEGMVRARERLRGPAFLAPGARRFVSGSYGMLAEELGEG